MNANITQKPFLLFYLITKAASMSDAGITNITPYNITEMAIEEIT
jgi:hypothetical protein